MTTEAITTTVVAPLNRASASRGQLSLVWSQFRRNRGAVLGLTVALILIALAVFSRWIAPYDPLATNPPDRLQGPSWSHLMGTDKFGRDLFSRIVIGAPQSLKVGFLAIVVGGVPGVTLGLIAGYYRRWFSTGIMMIADAMLGFPTILLALSIVTALGTGLTNTAIAIGVAWTPYFLRVARGSVLAVRSSTYVEAARVTGCSDRRLLTRHILPNVLAPIVVLCTLGMGNAILLGASLSFLGLGSQPPSPEWGAILNDGRSILRLAPWVTTFPGLMIMLTVFATNLLGDGLRDALDPRLKS